jgi:lipid-binding SYLF domain-containing protein
MFIVLGGTPGASCQVICPAVSKLYFVTNNTGFAQTFKTSAGSGISVPNGARIALRCDGTDVLEALTYFGSLTLGTALPVASGGTGATTAATALSNLGGVTPGKSIALAIVFGF